jgi:hypothetical protein
VPDERTYHVERARAELDAAYRAERADIAAIHLKLCALHMERAGTSMPDTGPEAGHRPLQTLES